MSQASKSPLGGPRTTARAFFVSDRLNTSGLERGDVLATTPLAFRVNENGVAILFRYGVVVLIGLNALEEEEFLRGLQSRMTGVFARRDEEIATIELASEREDQIPPGGPICLQSLSPERLILIGEALAKPTEPLRALLSESAKAPARPHWLFGVKFGIGTIKSATL